VEPQLFEQLRWEEIPARRVDDPGAKVVQLSRNQAGTSITSLVDCRPRWILDEHSHRSDVVTYCIRGGGLLGVEGKNCNFTEGQTVIIPVDTPHQFQSGPDGAFMLILVIEPLS
jgi:quercetin dioxygenase-like cupin family protein